MLYCPNCNGQIEGSPNQCPHCSATFRDESSLRPMEKPLDSFLPLRASPVLVLGFAPILLFAVVYAFSSAGFIGTMFNLLMLFLVPPALIQTALIAFVLAAVVFAGLEMLGAILNRVGALTLLAFLATCGVIGFFFGSIPYPFQNRLVNPRDLLLEEYADAVAFYTLVLYVLSIMWWLSYHHRRGRPQ
jgi:hypothetical protein